MQALLFQDQAAGLVFQPNYPTPTPRPEEVLVRLRAAALNHRDVWITKGLYPGIVPGVVLGSDGVGEYQERRVLINPNVGWGDNPHYPAKGYTILGMPVHGTFAEYICLPPDRLVDLPDHLSWSEGAALPLGGLTAYRAVFGRGGLQPGERVLVTGAGGGVALFAIQFALAAGAEVYTTSGSDDKLAKAQALGVRSGVNYRTEGWDKQLQQQAGSFDLIIDSAGGEGFNALVKLAAPGGRLVSYGGSLGAVPRFSPQAIFWKQLSILGTSMGSDEEFRQMVQFVDQHKLHPVVDSVRPLAEGLSALAHMEAGRQFGKIVLET